MKNNKTILNFMVSLISRIGWAALDLIDIPYNICRTFVPVFIFGIFMIVTSNYSTIYVWILILLIVGALLRVTGCDIHTLKFNKRIKG